MFFWAISLNHDIAAFLIPNDIRLIDWNKLSCLKKT